MHPKLLKISAIILLGFGLTGLQAQEALPASGGNASGSGGSVCYSTGQIVYTTYTGINGSVAEGVQQPYEISVVTATEKTKGINLMVSAYPNPTINYLILEINEFDDSNLSYQMYDMKGKLLQNGKVADSKTNISMNNLIPATYFIKVIQNNKEVKTFKIIKK